MFSSIASFRSSTIYMQSKLSIFQVWISIGKHCIILDFNPCSIAIHGVPSFCYFPTHLIVCTSIYPFICLSIYDISNESGVYLLHTVYVHPFINPWVHLSVCSFFSSIYSSVYTSIHFYSFIYQFLYCLSCLTTFFFQVI